MAANTSPTPPEGALRLAFRREGQFINAYMATTESLKGSKLLATIHVALLESDEHAYDELVAVISRAFGAWVSNTLGVNLTLSDPQPAPEHEKAGRA